MRLRLALRAVGGAVIAGVVGVIAPVPRGPVLAAYLVFLGGLVLVEVVAATARTWGGGSSSLFERAISARAASPKRPDDLVRLEDQVALATSAASDVYVRLRPLLREAAAQRLRSRHGVELDVQTDRARELLGDEAWELVRPDLVAPADRFGPGIRPARLARVLDAVEAL